MNDQQKLGTVRDALALVASADREDHDAVMTFLSLYNSQAVDDYER